MSAKAVAALVGAILIIVMDCVAGLGLAGGGLALAACSHPVTITTSASSSSTPTGGWPEVGDWSTEQVTNAAIIAAVGQQLHVPVRGWVIAVATAMQESNLHNLGDQGTHNDHDSLGLFQQRPSQGWGTADQILDPVYAATQFYYHLANITNWQDLPLTDAAQRVQKSAYPDAYAKWEDPATTLVNAVGSSGSWAMAIDLEHCPSNCPTILSNSGGPTPATPVATPQATANRDGGCTAGLVALGRAETWLTAWNSGPVPYLSSDDPTTWFQGYRRDCSGYASMALGLPRPGLNSAGLAARGIPIAKNDLQAGDLLINPAPDIAGHVVIFDHWTDATMTSYVGYEQAGDGGTHHRTIPYPYFGGYQMKPYRL